MMFNLMTCINIQYIEYHCMMLFPAIVDFYLFYDGLADMQIYDRQCRVCYSGDHLGLGVSGLLNV